MVIGVLKRRFCVDMIGGTEIYLFLVGLGYDASAGVGAVVVVCLFIRFLSVDQSSRSGSR